MTQSPVSIDWEQKYRDMCVKLLGVDSMTQVVHSEDEFQKILDRAMQLYTDNATRDTFRNLDYWIYVATKERIANWFMHNE